jgi:hypothetical protein
MSDDGPEAGGGCVVSALAYAFLGFLVVGGLTCAYHRWADDGDPPAAPTAYQGEPLRVSAEGLVADYRADRHAFQQRYGGGQVLDVVGTVDSASRALFGVPYVRLLVRTDSMDRVSCEFRKDRAGILKLVRPGEEVTVRGTLSAAGESGSGPDGTSYSVSLDDCALVVNGKAR